jgi:hypothetical protein
MLAIAPVRDGRYLWPLFPMVAFGLVFGVYEALQRLLRTPRLTALVWTGGVVLLVSAATVRALRAPVPPTLEQDAELQAMFEWVRNANAEEPARVMFANPRVLILETGAAGMAIVPVDEPATLLSHLEQNRITHVVQGDPATVVRGQASLEAMIVAYPERFTLQFQSPPYRVHRFHSLSEGTATR